MNSKRNPIYTVAIILLIVVVFIGYQLLISRFSQTQLAKNIESRNGYKIVSQQQTVPISFRIEPKYIPKKQGDIFNLHKEIYNENNTKIYLETVALYNPPKNTRDLFIELKFEQTYQYKGGRFVTPTIYNNDDTYSEIMFQPKYYLDNGNEIYINDGNGNKEVFFMPDQLKKLEGGLTIKFSGYNLVEYSKK
jgi:hypothetical protein